MTQWSKGLYNEAVPVRPRCIEGRTRPLALFARRTCPLSTRMADTTGIPVSRDPLILFRIRLPALAACWECHRPVRFGRVPTVTALTRAARSQEKAGPENAPGSCSTNDPRGWLAMDDRGADLWTSHIQAHGLHESTFQFNYTMKRALALLAQRSLRGALGRREVQGLTL